MKPNYSPVIKGYIKKVKNNLVQIKIAVLLKRIIISKSKRIV